MFLIPNSGLQSFLTHKAALSRSNSEKFHDFSIRIFQCITQIPKQNCLASGLQSAGQGFSKLNFFQILAYNFDVFFFRNFITFIAMILEFSLQKSAVQWFDQYIHNLQYRKMRLYFFPSPLDSCSFRYVSRCFIDKNIKEISEKVFQ